jgi:MFS superfamily sulfate permease-like transporter
LLPIAASCFVIIIAQSAATSRAFAERYGERSDENANLLGLSAANLTAGLSGAFVVNGSPTQTAMADNAGSRSQFAQLIFSGTVVVVLLFLCRWLQYLPHCVLAGIVFTIAIRLVNVRTMLAIRRESPGEFRLALITALAVVFIGVGNGILLAIALSLLRHVRHSYRPNSTVLVEDKEGHRWSMPADSGTQTAPGLIVFRFNADLFYANDHYFCDEVRRLIKHAPTPVNCFIVDAGAMTDLDYSAGRTVNELCKELAQKQIRIIFARVSNFLRADMDRHGITPVIGLQNIYPTLHQALEKFPPNPTSSQA